MILSMLAAATAHVNFNDLHLMREFVIPLPFTDWALPIRFYSLAYIIGIFGAYWGVRRMVRRAGAPMADRHIDDLLFWAMLGVIGGGRLGYVLFYNFSFYLSHPGNIVRLWDGGMSFHGGLIGVALAMLYVSWRNKLHFLRVADYVSCVVPFGMMLGRLANFVNGELWGRVTDVPWAIIFPDSGSMLPRHPSQLYEAALEGLLLLVVLSYLFWRTRARYQPGLLTGVFTFGMGLARFTVEFFREPDAQLQWLAQSSGLSMGQWLTIPLMLVGLYLIVTAKGRRQRVEPFAGSESIA